MTKTITTENFLVEYSKVRNLVDSDWQEVCDLVKRTLGILSYGEATFPNGYAKPMKNLVKRAIRDLNWVLNKKLPSDDDEELQLAIAKAKAEQIWLSLQKELHELEA